MTTGKLINSDFVHLHNHTHHSLLDGLTKIPALVEYVKAQGMEAVAMTDHGTLSGAVDFYLEAVNAEIKPIIGMETYIAARKHTDKEPGKDKPNFHLTLLAMNNTGYRNLMKLSSIANLEGFYYKPRLDRELLEKYNEGIIVLSGCIGGEFGDALRYDQEKKAEETAKWYKSVFGDRYYLEVHDHGHPDHPTAWDEQVKITKATFKLSKKLDIPTVITSDAHYLKKEDQEAHEILLCVQTGSFLTDEKRMSLKDFDLHVTEPTEIIKRWGPEHPESVRASKEIADRCSVQLDLGKILIPEFPIPEGETERSHLSDLVYSGLVNRFAKDQAKSNKKLSVDECKKLLSKPILDRAEYELGIINSMGFNGYFLIIEDFINWGKKEGIVFGPGRGSAAGSIIAYALNITELDPLKYDLLFERFLNPDRISMPDIDIDIQDSRRNEVIEYCVEKYGDDRVANIVTFGTMAARNAVRDVSRVLQVPYSEADRLAKMIPPPIQGRHTPLEVSLKENQELKSEYNSSDQSKRVFDLAVRLEGTIRSHGVHAAGVVIAPDEIIKFSPLEMAQKGVVATQYPMNPIEELGLLKMDFLGLSNLTIINNALRIIKKVYKMDIDINQLPLDDKKTYDLLSRGSTTGVFQLESAGMKRYLKELKPSSFDDIIAMVALYRPGPMQFIDDFIDRKHGRKKIEYLHPKMKSALEPSYGVLVYQEQVMQISRDLCGFTGGQSDTLRKAIGKKIVELMAKMKSEFIEGGMKHSGADRDMMEKFWKQLEDFAAYCFNKSHAACYGLIAYQTAYLKANYPDAYMAALLTSDFDDTDRLAIEIKECQDLGIEVLAPDINESFQEFAVVPGKNQIRFGLNAIKNVGSSAAEEIVRARSESGDYESIEDFFQKVNPRTVNKKTLESLIKSGGFDALSERNTMLENLESIVAFAHKVQKDTSNGQVDIFGNSNDMAHHSKPVLTLGGATTAITVQQQLQWERELLGIYLSQHPLKQYRALLEEQTVAISEIKTDHHNKAVTIGGAIVASKEIVTKKGQALCFATITDEKSEIEVIVFPGTYQQTIGLWERDKVLIINGKVSSKDKDGQDSTDIKIIANEAREVTPEQANAYQPTGNKKKTPKPSQPKTIPLKTQKRLYLRIGNSDDQKSLSGVKQIIDSHPGKCEVVLVFGSGSSRQAIKIPKTIEESTASMEDLKNLLGSENVKKQ